MKWSMMAGRPCTWVILALLAAPSAAVLAGENGARAEAQLLLAILKAEGKAPLAGAHVEYSWGAEWHRFLPAGGGGKGTSAAELSPRELNAGKGKTCNVNYAVTARVRAHSLKGKRMIPPRAYRVVKKGHEPAYFVPRFDSQDGKLSWYQEVLLRPEAKVTLSLKILNAADKTPLPGARLQYHDWYAMPPKYAPVPEGPDYMWRDFGGPDGSSEAPPLSRNALSGPEGNRVNYTARGHVPDFRQIDKRQLRVVFRVLKEGFETAYFFADLRALEKEPEHRREMSLRPLGMIGRWPLDKGQGAVAAEATGQGNAGKISGAEWVKQDGRSALRFDGIDDFVDFGRSPVYEQRDAITVLAWIKPAGEVSRMESLVGRGWRNPYALYTRKGNGLEVSLFLGAHKDFGQWHGAGKQGAGHYLTKEGVLKPGEWNMVGFSYSRKAGIRLYHNGKKVAAGGSLRGKGPMTPYICVPSNQRLSIGYFDGMGHFKGLIDDVRMYNYELSEPEIEKVYKGTGK